MTLGETCDDGSNDGLGCNTGCIGFLSTWICSGGNLTSPSICTPNCGDGIKVGNEACDDGNEG